MLTACTGPAKVVHGDYSLTSAVQRLRDMTKPPEGSDVLSGSAAAPLLEHTEVETAIASGRYGIINVWRNLADTPVATDPLAFCEPRSFAIKDLVVFEIHYPHRIGENYFAKHSPEHEWYYYPGLTRDEPVLLKTWDSAGQFAKTQGAEADSGSSKPASLTIHSAFADPTTPPDAPGRFSCEVRCAVLW